MNQSAQLQIDTVFHAAIEIDSPQERREYLDRACGDHAELRRQADRLIDAHFRGGSIIDQPAHVAIETIDGPSAEKPGTLIGPYKLLEQIGEGGMGLVYMAEQQRPVRRLVALKLIKPGMDSKQVIARFEAERQALALMDHPNIAKVLDAGTIGAVKDEGGRMKDERHVSDSSFSLHPSSFASTRPYFVMELVRGLPLNDFCDEKRLSVRERLELFIQICQAVQHAHQKGIIHRDLKPTNVLVTMHDSTPVPMIIDFGIAKALGQSLTDHTLHTGYSQLIGTPLYMSPEQAEMNQLGVDTRSDVYSLGVMLYELLTGTTPFDKETLTKNGIDAMRKIIREQEPPRPSARVSTLQAEALSTISNRRGVDPRRISTALHGELDWIVMKALEKERSERYESASSLSRDIDRYLHDEAVQACPPSTAYRFRKFARKNRASFTTALIVAASLLLGTAISIWQAVRATAAEAQSKENEKKVRKEEQKALIAGQAEALQRHRAQVSEQEAKDRLADVERQRKQTEESFQAALEAVDRMLTHVSEDELNDVPRIGPLRRKMLKDTVAFFDRIPSQAALSIDSQYRMAMTWLRILGLSWDLNEYEQALSAANTAVSRLDRLASAQPGNTKFKSSLADALIQAGRVHLYLFQNSQKAEPPLRRAVEIYTNLTRKHPADQRWLFRQVDALNYLAQSLSADKREEAVGCLHRARDLLEGANATDSIDYGRILYQLAMIKRFNPEIGDELYSRAIAILRTNQTGDKASGQDRIQFAHILWAAASRNGFRHRQPNEVEKMLDESISILREICGPNPASHGEGHELIRALRAQVGHLRWRASQTASNSDDPQAANRLHRADELFHEALNRQRKLVARFVLPQDQVDLVTMLHEECELVLREPAGSSAMPRAGEATDRLRADALLTEAIQLCRALAAEFPDNAEYKNRLADLLKLQAQHFGQEDGTKQAETEENSK